MRKLGDEELLSTVKEILKWVRFSGLENVRSELARVLDNDQKRLVYHLSDGKLTSAEIAQKTNISDFTVRNYWSQWYRRGIVEALSVRGGTRYMKSFELDDFGLIVPDVSVLKAKEVPPKVNENGT